jgi:hypothetical protein
VATGAGTETNRWGTAGDPAGEVFFGPVERGVRQRRAAAS